MASNRLSTTITIGGAISAGLRSAIGSTVDGLRRVGGAISDVQRRQRDIGAAIEANRRAGRSVRDLERQYRELGGTIDRLRAQQNRLARNHNATQNNLSNRANYRSKIGETVALGIGAAAPIVAAAKFETAMLGVAKQVQGARDASGKLTAEYYAMAKQVQLLGREIPIATNDLAEMVAAGARMGVAKEALIDFTKTSAMMASAFDLPAAELADNMGKIAGLYKIPIPAIGQLADTINWLDDNAISKGGDIIEFLTRTGGVAGAVKVTGQEMAALGSTLLTLGERTETASTATNAMFQKLAAADKGTKKFKAAMKEIGLSTAAVQKGMQIDAQGTLMTVLEKISKLPKDKQLGVMVELVGLEHSDTLAKLAGGLDEYKKQIKLAASAEAKGSMSREFQAQRATAAAQWVILKNRVVELAVSIGTVLLPAVNDIMGGIGEVVTLVSEWAQAHPGLTKAIVGTVVALTSVKVAAWAAGYAFTFLRGAVLSVTGAYARVAATLTTLAAGTTRTGAGVRMLGAALSRLGSAVIAPLLAVVRPLVLAFAIAGSPMWVVAAAGAAIAAAGVLIWKYWEPLKAFFIGFGEGLMSGLAPIGQAFSNAFSPVWEIIGPMVMPILEAVGGWVRSAASWFGGLFTPIDKASKTTAEFAAAGKVCGEVIAQAFTFMLSPIMLVVDAIKWVNGNIGGIIEKSAKVGSAISGGWQATKDFVTGGPDTSLPPMRGAAAGSAAGAASQTNTYHITQLPGENAEQLARRVAEIQKRQQGVEQRGKLTDGTQ